MSLGSCAGQLRTRLEDSRSQVRPETARQLGEQLNFVEELVKKSGSAMLLNFFLLGEHYLRLDRYDFAALLFYRTIEKSLAERLNREYGGFRMDSPDYTLLHHDVNDLSQRYSAAAMEMFRSDRQVPLPFKVGLIDAVLLLHLLNDEMLRKSKITDLNGIRHLAGLADARNRSVLAHGEQSVTSGQCSDLRQRALHHLRVFWQLHERGWRVDDRISTLQFVAEA